MRQHEAPLALFSQRFLDILEFQIAEARSALEIGKTSLTKIEMKMNSRQEQSKKNYHLADINNTKKENQQIFNF